jgi:hypothetical protein
MAAVFWAPAWRRRRTPRQVICDGGRGQGPSHRVDLVKCDDLAQNVNHYAGRSTMPLAPSWAAAAQAVGPFVAIVSVASGHATAYYS